MGNKDILTAVQDKSNQQKHIAAIYAKAVRRASNYDWPCINQTIIKRWSQSGLLRVKKMAWDIIKTKEVTGG